MGAFCLVHEENPTERERLAKRMQASLEAQGFAGAGRVTRGRVSCAFYGKLCGASPQLHRAADRFLGLTGTALADGAADAAAIDAMLADDARPAFARLTGNFCIVRGDATGVRLFVDPLGVYKVYCTPDRRLFSSSFLAVAEALGRISPDAQGVYEYVHQEATYGGATVCREIELARCDGRYVLDSAVAFEPWESGWAASAIRAGGDTAVHVDACAARLRTLYRGVTEAFGQRIDTALSGGYDSRLTLALLLERGVKPFIHVYGSPTSSDVQVARTIADGEGLDLEHVDKGRMSGTPGETFEATVERNFMVFDGYPPSGIFDHGADLRTRLARASGGRLMLNGGGGEIFRNFFYLPARSFSATELVWSFYNRYCPSWCTAAFDEERYVETLAGKISRSVGGGERLTREEVEYAYPAFRCAYWMGRNNSLNSRIGWSLTPFIDRDLVRLALRVPLRLKNHGRFEAALIRAVSPALSRYRSDYGHAFDREPPLGRILRDQLTLRRPPWIRRFTYRVRFRNARARPPWLATGMLSQVIDPALPVMSQFFRTPAVNDPQAFARIATLEYLFRRFGER